MSTDLFEHAQNHFAQHLRLSLAQLLEPIDTQQPAGYCVKGSGVYQAIQGARREDDPRLPQGPWQHELKRADWAAVCSTAADNLQRKAKDLQLAAWLLEAQIHQCGFAGIAPSLVLIDELLHRFWQHLYPQEADGDTAHRANILRWINRKLLPVLKQVPLTAAGQGAQYGWADREAAWRREQQKTADTAAEGEPTLQAVNNAMADTAASHHLALRCDLELAIEAASRLTRTVDACFSGDKPSLSAFIGLLRQMLAAVETELHRRGLLVPPVVAHEQAHAHPLPGNAEAGPERSAPPPTALARANAYALLEQAAKTLLVTDPHSPTPYLVQRAVQWGRLSTSELYKEVFIRMGGQLSIFELLGLEAPQTQAE
jgi:type VI secretion system protein ImpA